MSAEFDLTVAITAHNESVVAGPSLASIEIALAEVTEAGFTVERLIGLDSPSKSCRDYFGQSVFSNWRSIECDNRDQGLTRNALAQSARGQWLAFVDADDLVSRNWLINALRQLQEDDTGKGAIAHPELIWQFDRSKTVYVQPGQDSRLYTPHHFAMQNYYDAMCMAPRAVWLEIPFAKRSLADGFAYEDWQWMLETTDEGWRHICVPDTVIFKRRRDSSQSSKAVTRRVSVRAVKALAIDRIRQLV